MRTTALDDTDTYIQALHAYVQDAPVHRLVEAFRTSAEPSYTKLVRKMLRIPRFQESERFLPRTLAQWLQVAACTQMPWYYHPDSALDHTQQRLARPRALRAHRGMLWMGPGLPKRVLVFGSSPTQLVSTLDH